VKFKFLNFFVSLLCVCAVIDDGQNVLLQVCIENILKQIMFALTAWK
jgi:hypothetical protein